MFTWDFGHCAKVFNQIFVGPPNPNSPVLVGMRYVGFISVHRHHGWIVFQAPVVPILATERNSASRWANIKMTLMRWNCKLQRCSKSSVLNFPANMKYHKTRLFLVPHHTCALYIFQVDVADIGDKTLSFCLVEQVQGYGMSDGDDAGCRNPPACWGKLTFPWQGSLCPPGTRRPSSTSRFP